MKTLLITFAITLQEYYYDQHEQAAYKVIPLSEQIFTAIAFIGGLLLANRYFGKKAKTPGERNFMNWFTGIVIFIIISGLFT